MEFHPITLQDRPVFDKSYRTCRHEGSESSFTNLFIWRKPLDIVWTRADNAICVVVRNDGPIYALHPCAATDEDIIGAAGKLADWFREQGLPVSIRGLEKSISELLAEAFPAWTIEHDRCEDDYIYSIKELIELKGRKFEAKRHHIRTFLRNTPEYSYEAMNPATALECLPVARRWLERQHSDDRSEDLLGHGAVGARRGEHGRREPEAGPVGGAAAKRHRGVVGHIGGDLVEVRP